MEEYLTVEEAMRWIERMSLLTHQGVKLVYLRALLEKVITKAKLEERKLVLSEIGEDEEEGFVKNWPKLPEEVATVRNYFRKELRQKTLKRIEELEK